MHRKNTKLSTSYPQIVDNCTFPKCGEHFGIILWIKQGNRGKQIYFSTNTQMWESTSGENLFEKGSQHICFHKMKKKYLTKKNLFSIMKKMSNI